MKGRLMKYGFRKVNNGQHKLFQQAELSDCLPGMNGVFKKNSFVIVSATCTKCIELLSSTLPPKSYFFSPEVTRYLSIG
jgi:hypothetical protein